MILLLKFIIFCAVIHFGMVSAGDDCECVEHIFCLYPTSSPGAACIDYEKDGFREKEKGLVLKRINEYRNKVALGKEKRGDPGPQPSAADMMEVTWDDYLGATAQRYADQCIFKHSPSACRIAENFKFGENLAWGKNKDMSTVYLEHIDSWYNEVKNFPYYLADAYYPGTVNLKGKIGHYAQLINAKTYKIGCGKSRWGPEDLLVCHFGPTVYRNKPLYIAGPPASMCEEGTASSYEGLCGSGPASMSEDRTLPPYEGLNSSGTRSCISNVLMESLFLSILI